MTKRVLIVEDDKAIARLLRDNLEYEGFVVETCDNGHEALATVKRFTPDLLLLDLMLPHGVDGFDICKALHESPTRVPVIILSARAQKEDRIKGLTLGADDYVTKPFALDELLARVRALLRRTHEDGTDKLGFADLELDPGTREVTRGGVPIDLTRTEFSLLELFMRNPRQVLTRSVIFERVWGYDFGFGSNSLDVYIGYLRRKTEAGDKPRLIQTVRGVGYALREP